MRNWIIVFITFSFILKVAFSADKAKGIVMPKKWYHLNKIIDKEIKTVRSRGKRIGPRLRYRLVELYSEKTRLIREKETKELLAAPSAFTQKMGKEFFYKNSMVYFNKAKQEALNIIREFPRFIHNGDIYYTLALNERDYNKNKEHQNYLRQALKFAEAGSPTIHKAKVALAEYYYNNKEFSEAISYYNDVLKYKRDHWYSKHLYNSAWCHIKINRTQKAIELLKESFEYSRKKNYINIEDQVYKSIGLFYVTLGTPLEAVKFYLKKAKDPHEHLLGLSDMTSNRGDIKNSSIILSTALKEAKKRKNYKHQAEVLHKQLVLFHHFKRSNEIYATAKALLIIKKKHGLDVTIHEDSVEKVTSHVGFLQVELASNINRYDKIEKAAKSKRILRYFNLLISFNKKNSDQYRFYQGETLYAVSEYEGAAKLYIKALEFSKKYKPKDKDFKLKIINSLFSALATAEMTSNKMNKYNIYAYSNYLELWPKSEKSPDIYKKLFNVYMAVKKNPKATDVFYQYYKHYPEHNEIHKGMVTLLIDDYIKKKDFNNLSAWMIKLDSGFLNYKKDYVLKGMEILASMLFEQYEKLGKEGKFKQAVEGYIGLFNNKKYPRKIHAQSAYNAAVLFLENGDVEKSLVWMNNSLAKFNEKETMQLQSKIYAISENYYLLQDFKRASSLSVTMVKKYCGDTKSSTLNNFYKNAVIFQLLENDTDQAMANYKAYKQCKIKDDVRIDAAKKIITFFAKKRNYDKLFEIYPLFITDIKLKEDLMTTFADAYWDTKMTKLASDQLKIRTLLAKHKNDESLSSDSIESIENIFAFEEYEKLYKNTDLHLAQDKKKFSEERFNQQLEANFSKLNVITTNGENIVKQKHPVMTLAVYQMLENKYTEMRDSIAQYTPQQMPKEFVDGFKKQMQGVAAQLGDKGASYKNIALKTIDENNIFNQYSKEISGGEILDEYRYPASKLTLPLDL